MLLFSHIGFTLGAALLINSAIRKACFKAKTETVEQSNNAAATPVLRGPSAKYWTLIKRAKGLDLRFVIIGSLLPDIIDKPIGHYFFYEKYGDGYLYGHTLLFVLLLAIAGYLIYVISKKGFIFMLAFGSLAHLVLDLASLPRRVLFWPLFGFTFEKGHSHPFFEWLLGLVIELFRRPWIGLPELIGAIITVWFFWLLWHQKQLLSFLLTGKV